MAYAQIRNHGTVASVAAADATIIQPGSIGTAHKYATISQILSGGLPGSFSTLAASGAFTPSRAAAVTAAGTNQATATALTGSISIVTTVSAGQGVKLPDNDHLILNRGTVSLLVYPQTGAQIETYGTNTAVTLVADVGSAEFLRASSTLYRVD